MGDIGLVSVVIPVWNASGRIDRAIQSVVAQTYRPLEIIVVDDGSSDGTPQSAARVLDICGLPGRLIPLPVNSGPSAARNVGWRAAEGPWIQFLDDDDELHPLKIDWQAQAISQTNEDVACFYSRWAARRNLKAGGVVETDHCPELKGIGKCEQLASILRSDNFIPFACALSSRSWLEKVGGFDEKMRLIEDIDLQLRLIASGAVFREVPVDMPIFWYNDRRESVSNSRRREFVEGIVRNAKIAFALCEQNGGASNEMVEIMRQTYTQAIVYYASQKQERVRFEELFSEGLKFFGKKQHRSGSALFAVVVRFIGWRRAELFAGNVRNIHHWLLTCIGGMTKSNTRVSS